MLKSTPEPYTPSILIVDDSVLVRTLFRRILEEAGYFAAEAASGREAVRMSRHWFFDVAVVDLSLPDMDGFDLVRAIRSELPTVKVLMVSGFMVGSLLPIARKLGADATLEKASAGPVLLKTVCDLLAT